MSYRFCVNAAGGQFGWFRWRNTIPRDTWPEWMHFKDNFWGAIGWSSALSEQACNELVALSEDLGMYD